jgi:hypothetical protein
VLSSSSSSVKIARTTSDGNWTLTQTISKVASPASIKIVMALKNNHAVSKVAYLVRYSAVTVDGGGGGYAAQLHNSSFAWNDSPAFPNPDGLQLQNVGTPPFGFWQAYAEINAGPNACAFASAGGTRTATVAYRGF